jgi:hypothetical protein
LGHGPVLSFVRRVKAVEKRLLVVALSAALSILWHRRRQRKSVQNITHPPAKRLIDHLVLLDPRFARKVSADDVSRVVIPIARQVLNLDGGVRKGVFDQTLDIIGFHGHGRMVFSSLNGDDWIVRHMTWGREPINPTLTAKHMRI